jgi:hypothetical protein
LVGSSGHRPYRTAAGRKNGQVVTSVKATNIFNQTIQQEVYGDILKFGLVAEVRIVVK